jgi:E3 ubiquitin-protein ligase HUWE1
VNVILVYFAAYCRLIFENFTWNFQHLRRGTGAKDEPEIPALPSGASPFSGDSSTHVEASIALKPGGNHIRVSNTNKREYILLKAQKMLMGAIESQMSAVIDAFHSLIPRELIEKYAFTPLELQLLVCGEQRIDIGDLQRSCKYEDGYTGKEEQITWFWQAVESMDEPQRRALLQFWSGSDGMPAEGFASLEPAFHLVSVDRMYDRNDKTARLPAAHTCFRQLDLPRYRSYEELREKMLTAITMGQGYMALS